MVKISIFIHILSVALIYVAVFGMPVVESLLRKESDSGKAFSLHQISLKFSQLARIGGVLVLLSGIGNMVFTEVGLPLWLVLKLILFLLFVVLGVIFGRRYFSAREEALKSGADVEVLNSKIQRFVNLNILIFILIIFLAVFKIKF